MSLLTTKECAVSFVKLLWSGLYLTNKMQVLLFCSLIPDLQKRHYAQLYSACVCLHHICKKVTFAALLMCFPLKVAAYGESFLSARCIADKPLSLRAACVHSWWWYHASFDPAAHLTWIVLYLSLLHCHANVLPSKPSLSGQHFSKAKLMQDLSKPDDAPTQSHCTL